MNIDENLIEAAITEKAVAIVPVHYAGILVILKRYLIAQNMVFMLLKMLPKDLCRINLNHWELSEI